MRIIYACSGEGTGHGSLARSILPVLKKAGHKIKVITYGQSIDRLKEYDMIKIRGIKHYYNSKGEFSLPRSVIKNLSVFPYFISNWGRLKREIKEFSPDVFVVNFEPFTPLIARSMKIPVISFDNQHALLYINHDVPKGMESSALISKTAIRFVVPWAKYFIILAFGNPVPNRKDVYIVPPVIQQDIIKLKPKKTGKVFVYLKKPNPSLLELLKKTKEKYVIYGYNMKKKDNNLTYCVFSNRMHKELAESKAVVATAGMSLVSEAAYLKKPYFAVPLKNEFEQLFTAMFLKKSNFGDYAEEPTLRQIERFFENITAYEKSLKKYSFDPNAAGKKLLETINKVKNKL